MGRSRGGVPRIARVIPPHEALVEELAELIAIPSVSADPAHADDVRRAADWVVARITAAGGSAEIQKRGERPLVIGRVPASSGERAPTVLVYAHLDVQPPEPLELWESDPWTLDRARRQALRTRRRRRQGPPLHAARGDRRPRLGRRAAGERALRDRRRGGGRRALGRRLGRGGHGSGGRRARPRRRLRHGDAAVDLHRAARYVLLPPDASVPASATSTRGCTAARR